MVPQTMLKYLLISCLCLLSNQLIAQHHEESSDPHHIMMEGHTLAVGVGSPYSFHVEGLGVNSRVYYNIGERLCFGPEFSLFGKRRVRYLGT